MQLVYSVEWRLDDLVDLDTNIVRSTPQAEQEKSAHMHR